VVVVVQNDVHTNTSAPRLTSSFGTLAMLQGAVDRHTMFQQMGTSAAMLECHNSQLTATMAAEKWLEAMV
jgi:hypothetical protein